ncbi:hypothetical protein [Pseudoroseicyclus tamaricis]|uniref:Cytochrome c domain-containing protein n=1 Tax=Pseudoroseicyclus tamaricis TaxID=2705421 RepID=A0A6B2JLT8_9RHOB|nr:hypothetical protein [Pseudoroseicyclus tamaricis]NDV02533.1 hypothetical protein [Pseudoroseicyclus tamaricis]
MIGRLLLALALALCAGPLAAQSVTMRSGEHPTFTRLVLAVPPGRDWRLGRSDEGYLLDLGRGVSFDSSGVFERIPRDRLAALEDRGNGVLELELACETCHATLFRWREDRLVLDIRDGPAPAGSPAERPLTLAGTPPPPPVEEEEEAAPDATLPIVVPPAEEEEPLLPFAPAMTDPDMTRVAEMEADILQSLSRAATLGLIELQPGLEDVPEPVLAPSDPPEDAPEGMVPGEPGVDFRTSLDRDRAVAPPHDSCLPDSYFDMASWVPEEAEFATEIGPRRVALTGEFDRVTPGAAEDLARGYLYYGFGAEARDALALDSDPSVEHRVLTALAAIVDGLAPPSGILNGQQGCNARVSLWAALAAGSVEGLGEEGRSAVMLAYRTLPPPLQGHLGARLAQLFIEAEDSYTAESLINLSRPAVTGDTPESRLTETEVTRVTDGPEAALAELDYLLDDSTTLNTETLLRAIELTLELGRVPGDREISLARALRFERRGTEDELRLADAEIRALTAAGRQEAALELAADDRHPLSYARRGELNDAAVASIAEAAEDSRFLEQAMAPLPHGLMAPTENAIAARLLSLGFPERAEELLAGEASGASMRERRYLRAEAALLRGDPDGVVTALAGMRDPRAQALIARAEAEAGDYAAALAAQAEPEAETLWRAGAWDQLAGQAEDPLLAEAAAGALTPSALPEDTTPLAGRAALLAEAEETRAMVEELLGRFPVAEEDGAPAAD